MCQRDMLSIMVYLRVLCWVLLSLHIMPLGKIITDRGVNFHSYSYADDTYTYVAPEDPRVKKKKLHWNSIIQKGQGTYFLQGKQLWWAWLKVFTQFHYHLLKIVSSTWSEIIMATSVVNNYILSILIFIENNYDSYIITYHHVSMSCITGSRDAFWLNTDR